MSMITKETPSAVTSEESPEKGSAGSPLSFKLGRLSLNPNAQEFVPSSSRSGSSPSVGNVADLSASTVDSRSKANLDRTSSANSDDEYRQFWRAQLPDDLITDSDFSSDLYSESNQYDQQLLRDFDLTFGGRSGLTNSTNRNGEQVPPQRTNGSYHFDQDQHADLDRLSQKSAQHPWLNGVEGVELEQSPPDEVHPLGLLAQEFPNFAVQSLADIYYANGCDLGLTIEMLTQLELQEEGAPSRRTSRPSAAPSLTPMDFPSLPGVELMNGLSSHPDNRSVTAQRPMELATSLSRRFAPGDQGVDFAAVVRKQVAHQSSQWQYERNGGDISLGSARSSVQNLGGYGYSNRDPHRMGPQPQPWLETGEAVASMYSDMREEARDHARVRNAYFEQARQAYLVGNKALAKELSAKGQWHNEQMKVAHGKAAEAIYQQRNSSLFHLARDGQSRMIDLHGLHVGEAIPLLRREINALRIASRTTSKRQCVHICVGTGHHTKGSRTPARIPVAIERYLAEDERLQFSEVQPGMLRVIV